MSQNKSMTLAEHNAILAADPAYQKMRRDKDATLNERSQLLRDDAAPLLEDLKSVGWDVKSAWDLVNTATPYPSAIPVLLNHLKKPYIDRNREAIARALAVPAATYAWSVLREEYKSSPSGSGVKHGLAAALSAIVTDDVIDELVMLAKDQSNGESRVLLLNGLRRSRSPVAHDALADLADDPSLAKEIASWSSAR